jgi:hypothetical protein
LGYINILYEQKKKNSRDRIEEELGRARAAIRKALRTQNYTSDREEIYIPRGCMYKNPIAFHQLSFDNTSFFFFFFFFGWSRKITFSFEFYFNVSLYI